MKKTLQLFVMAALVLLGTVAASAAEKKIQVMVPPRNGMPAEAEAVWRSYCVRYNRELDAEKSAEGNKKKL